MCADRFGCPPTAEVVTESGKVKRVRPEHGRSCKAPWAYAVDRGMIAGKRERKVVTAATKPELLTKVAALREKLALGVDPDAQTVGAWLDYWLERVAPENGVRAGTLKGYRSKAKLYIKPALGAHKLQQLRPEHIEAMADWMRTLDKSRYGRGAGPLSETTIRQTHMVLRSALADALARRKITYNPAAVVSAPKAADNPHDHLTTAEAKLVLRSALDERELCRNTVALALGVRQGEALALRWSSDYGQDAAGHFLMVQESVQRIDGKLTRTGVKSAASHRRIPIPERMVPIFEAWRALAADDYIFPGPKGGPADAKRDWSMWGESLARAEVRHIPLHGARGSAASMLADMGVPDWMIAEILGHSQVIVTRKHYIKGTEEKHRAAIDGLITGLLDEAQRVEIEP